jgi:hypothetical protein
LKFLPWGRGNLCLMQSRRSARTPDGPISRSSCKTRVLAIPAECPGQRDGTCCRHRRNGRGKSCSGSSICTIGAHPILYRRPQARNRRARHGPVHLASSGCRSPEYLYKKQAPIANRPGIVRNRVISGVKTRFFGKSGFGWPGDKNLAQRCHGNGVESEGCS